MTAPSHASIQSGNLVYMGRLRRRKRKAYLINCLKITFAFAFVLLILVASPRGTVMDSSSMERTTSKVTGEKKQKIILSKMLAAYDGVDLLMSGKNRETILQKFEDLSSTTNQSTPTATLKKRLQRYMITGSARRTIQPDEDGTVHVWIAGSSAAAGYGNLPSQSYAVLLPLLLESIQDASFNVNSSAMMNISPFPYSWCLSDHYWKVVPQIVIYDFDEDISQPDPANLETFLRMVAKLRRDVMIIVRGLLGDESHATVLQRYAESVNIVVIADLSGESFDDAASDSVFGLPASAESLHSHNLSIQQHRWTALILALHIAAATQPESLTPRTNDLPPPVHVASSSLYLLDQGSIHCLTGYDHVNVERENGSQTLRYDTLKTSTSDLRKALAEQELVDWETSTSLLLLPKNTANFRRGWTWGVADRTSKLRQVAAHHQDWKVALFGLAMSGPLHLQISSEDLISSVMICQADDDEASECNLGADGALAADVLVKTTSSDRLCLLGTLDRAVRQVNVNVTVSATRKPCSVAHVIWTTIARS